MLEHSQTAFLTGNLSALNENHNSSIKNHILNLLPKQEYDDLLPFLEPISLSRHESIYHTEMAVDYVYFLSSGMIANIFITKEGKTIIISMIGNEGVVGINAVFGLDLAFHESSVQIPGKGFRVKTEAIRKQFRKGGTLQSLLMQYANSFLVQITQTVVCNQFHPLRQRIPTFLMRYYDLSESDSFAMTHEMMAVLLGVNRPTISTIVAKLKSKRIIAYNRGSITILDTKALEDLACKCNQVVKSEYGSAKAIKNHIGNYATFVM